METQETSVQKLMAVQGCKPPKTQWTGPTKKEHLPLPFYENKK